MKEVATDTALHNDILSGAGEIAEFLFGDARQRRRVYHLVEKNELPVFRLGDVICARKTTLTKHIAEQERLSLEMSEAV